MEDHQRLLIGFLQQVFRMPLGFDEMQAQSDAIEAGEAPLAAGAIDDMGLNPVAVDAEAAIEDVADPVSDGFAVRIFTFK